MFRCHLSGRERDVNEGGDSGAQPRFTGLESACRRSGGYRIKRGEEEKLKKLEGWSVRTARGRFLYSLGQAVVIKDGCIGTPYLKRQS